MRLGRDTWLEATLLTDFSQVDLDDALVNLDRFPLFFPERRPFFLNGLDVFAAGVAGQLVPFYSRRIGLSPSGSALPVLGGAKLYGREGPVSFGVLDVLTDEASGAPATNDLAGRVRVSLDGRASYVGALVTSRVPFHWDLAPVSARGAHVTYAADALVRLADERLELTAFGAGTARDDEPDVRDGGEGAAAAVGSATAAASSSRPSVRCGSSARSRRTSASCGGPAPRGSWPRRPSSRGRAAPCAR
ncbi:MAG: DUF5916 domain-containing protein [Sandaracinaceae bacterium]|nr:DUF5916 domain-containing protein [Sandaracinaceae bacterium]